MQTRSTADPALPTLPARRYAPSWVDALQSLVERLPWPAWFTYLGAWLALALVEALAKWADGSVPAGTLFPFHFVAFGLGWYWLALMHHLDREASSALAAFRPGLELPDDEVECVRYQLTTMPMAATLLATLLGVTAGLTQRFTVVAPHLDSLRFASSGWTFLFELLFVPIFGWGLMAVFVYHTFRQLGFIDRLYRQRVTVNLFHVGPLYAFSRFSARVALGILLIGYLWLTTYPRVSAASVMSLHFSSLALFSALAVLTFLWPLWGAHQRLESEKQRRKAEVTRRMETILAEQHQVMDAQDYAAMDGINKAISGLTTELAILERASTWPWQTSTLRGFLTAVFLPLFLWVAQQLLGRFLAP